MARPDVDTGSRSVAVLGPDTDPDPVGGSKVQGAYYQGRRASARTPREDREWFASCLLIAAERIEDNREARIQLLELSRTTVRRLREGSR